MESKWIKAEEADVPMGEVCVAIYKGFAFPIFAFRNSVNFTPFPGLPKGWDESIQPEFVLQMPPLPVGMGMLRDETD